MTMIVRVAFKPASLSVSELFRFGAEIRYPQSSRPVAAWIIRESLWIALLGGSISVVVGSVTSPTFFPASRLALLVIPLLLCAWALFLVVRIRWTWRAWQTTDVYIVELSEEGVSLQDRDSSWLTRWKPDYDIVLTPHFILIRCGKQATVWTPRQAFGSPEEAEEFVRLGRLFQATASGKTSQELKVEPVQEV